MKTARKKMADKLLYNALIEKAYNVKLMKAIFDCEGCKEWESLSEFKELLVFVDAREVNNFQSLLFWTRVAYFIMQLNKDSRRLCLISKKILFIFDN